MGWVGAPWPSSVDPPEGVAGQVLHVFFGIRMVAVAAMYWMK